MLWARRRRHGQEWLSRLLLLPSVARRALRDPDVRRVRVRRLRRRGRRDARGDVQVPPRLRRPRVRRQGVPGRLQRPRRVQGGRVPLRLPVDGRRVRSARLPEQLLAARPLRAQRLRVRRGVGVVRLPHGLVPGGLRGPRRLRRRQVPVLPGVVGPGLYVAGLRGRLRPRAVHRRQLRVPGGLDGRQLRRAQAELHRRAVRLAKGPLRRRRRVRVRGGLLRPELRRRRVPAQLLGPRAVHGERLRVRAGLDGRRLLDAALPGRQDRQGEGQAVGLRRRFERRVLQPRQVLRRQVRVLRRLRGRRLLATAGLPRRALLGARRLRLDGGRRGRGDRRARRRLPVRGGLDRRALRGQELRARLLFARPLRGRRVPVLRRLGGPHVRHQKVPGRPSGVLGPRLLHRRRVRVRRRLPGRRLQLLPRLPGQLPGGARPRRLPGHARPLQVRAGLRGPQLRPAQVPARLLRARHVRRRDGRLSVRARLRGARRLRRRPRHLLPGVQARLVRRGRVRVQPRLPRRGVRGPAMRPRPVGRRRARLVRQPRRVHRRRLPVRDRLRAERRRPRLRACLPRRLPPAIWLLRRQRRVRVRRRPRRRGLHRRLLRGRLQRRRPLRRRRQVPLLPWPLGPDVRAAGDYSALSSHQDHARPDACMPPPPPLHTHT